MSGKTNLKTSVLVAAFSLAIVSTTFAGRIIYVDADANGANSGSSWADAYQYLGYALDNASSGDDIHVAQGIYKPSDGYVAIPNFDWRTTTFQLKSGVVIKGGYAGFGEPDPDTRDIKLYKTILSGDLAGNDVNVNDPCDLQTEPTRSENSYHVVTGSETDATTVLDGFTITGGNANGPDPHDQGGGMLNERGSPTVTNCTFSGNSAHQGGGMYNYESSPALTLTNCTFSGNSADYSGGGMYNYDWAWPTLTNCTFSDNEAMWNGGAVYNYRNSSPTLTNCSLNGNLAENGGAVANYGNSSPTLKNCSLNVNLAIRNGGAIYNWESSPTITNCTFGGNSAHENGGAIYTYYDSNPSVTNCTFNGNCAQNGKAMACDSWYQFYPSNPKLTNCIFWDGGSEIWNNDDSAIIITYSDVQGGWPGEGNTDADPCFVRPGYWEPHVPPPPGVSYVDNTQQHIWVEGDYHLKSKAGRWDPKSREWLQDDVTSPCIDAGSPNSPIAFEPLPNGGVVNMGAYGGTAEASKSMVPITSGRIIFVDPDATGVSDGSSWVHAYNHLQDALAAASYGDQIWVAQGIYKPDQGHGIIPGDRLATFHLKNGLTIRGSYAGFGQPDPNARDIDLYETALSGDIGIPGDNCYHVVRASGTDKTAVLDGFTITCGFANVGHDSQFLGGGMLNDHSSPTIINCTFFDNGAIEGGGMANLSSSPTLTNCTFIGNGADMGAGLCNQYESNPTLTNCTFSGNSVKFSGGGMANLRSSPRLIACIFTGNSAAYGGGMDNSRGRPSLRNCIFSGNSADYGGGMYNWESSPRMTNCIFSGNWAKWSGGGIYVWAGFAGPVGGCFMGNLCNVTLINCIFAENLAERGRALFCGSLCDGLFPSNVRIANCILWDGGDEIWNSDASTISITYSDVEGGWPGEGNIEADPRFVDPGCWDPNGTPEDANDDFWVDGDYHLKSQAGRWDANEGRWTKDEVTSPCIDAGNPMSPIGFEPFPNGGRVNMGAYGGTVEASKSYFGKPVCQTPVAGDINGDCKVNFLDFRLMAFHWLRDENR